MIAKHFTEAAHDAVAQLAPDDHVQDPDQAADPGSLDRGEFPLFDHF